MTEDTGDSYDDGEDDQGEETNQYGGGSQEIDAVEQTERVDETEAGTPREAEEGDDEDDSN